MFVFAVQDEREVVVKQEFAGVSEGISALHSGVPLGCGADVADGEMAGFAVEPVVSVLAFGWVNGTHQQRSWLAPSACRSYRMRPSTLKNSRHSWRSMMSMRQCS